MPSEHQQCHRHREDAAAQSGEAFHALSGNTVVAGPHRTEISGLARRGQNLRTHKKPGTLNGLARLWAVRGDVRGILFLCGFIVATGICLAQDKPETPDTPQPAQVPPAQNLPDAPQPASSQTTPAADERKDDKKRDESGNPAEIAAQKTKEATVGALTWARDWESRWITGIFIDKDQERIPLTAAQRRDLYLRQTLTTPGAYMKRMFQAGFDQARGVPYQWDDGWIGYSERFGSRYGQFLASNSIAAYGNAKLKYEPRYDRCRCSGFWPRTEHAILRNFLTYNETETELRPQWALYAGAFGGGLISTAWKPKPRNAFAEGARAAAEQGGWGVALNFFIEFAGEINRKLGARQ